MRSFKIGIFLSLGFLLFFTVPSAQANNLQQREDSILLEGSVFNNETKVENAIIRVYINNKLYKSVKVSRSNKFKTNLPFNQMLTIEIAAPGFHSKRFMMDTNVPESEKSRMRYTFDMDIFSEEEMKGVNTSLLDFPVGLVHYDEKKGEFVHDKKYTKQMKKEYFNLLEQAKLSERSGMEGD